MCLTVYKILIMIILFDIYFYIVHRILHHKSIYKYIHKIHHKYNETVFLATEYSHFLEYTFANLVPIMFFMLFSSYSIDLIIIWITISMISVYENHSGYSIIYDFQDYH